jgi:hypothetical protein
VIRKIPSHGTVIMIATQVAFSSKPNLVSQIWQPSDSYCVELCKHSDGDLEPQQKEALKYCVTSRKCNFPGILDLRIGK